MRWGLLAIAACYVDPPRPPVANVVHPVHVVPYADMMTALCGRTEIAWNDAPSDLGGIRLVPNRRDDDPSTDRRSWRVVGAPPFRELREIRNGPLIGRAELQLERGSPRAICRALATQTRIEIQRSAGDRCAWQDPDSTHTLEVIVRNGHAWMACTL